MISIEELLINIPDGKKIRYLGTTFYNALKNYYDNYRNTEDIDLDSLVAINFKELILNDHIINDLKLFQPDKLNEIIQEKDLKNLSNNKIRKKLIDYYSLEYQKDINVPNEISNASDCEVILHDFQDRIRRKVINLIFQNQKRFLIHMPTGSGKTRTAGEIIVDFIRLSSSKALLNNKMKILWIAQSSELCYQAYETIKWLFDKKGTSNISIGHFYDSRKLPENIENNSAIIFCSIQQLLLHYEEPIWQKIKNDNYLVVVDEAHRSVAHEWVNALNYFVSNSSTYLLGLTATPGFGKKGDESNSYLSTYYNNNKISITDENYTEIPNPIEHLVQREFLAKINRIDIDSYVDLEGSISKDDHSNFKFTKKTLKQLSISHTRNSSIINIIKDNYSKGKKILVFTCGIEHNKILQAILTSLDIVSESVDTNSKNRNTLINRFKDGDLNILLNFGVLTTGFDAPKSNVAIIGRPTQSVTLYSQMIGRVMRGKKAGGNEFCKVVTVKDPIYGFRDMSESFEYWEELWD